jgi:hypothetical protein
MTTEDRGGQPAAMTGTTDPLPAESGYPENKEATLGLGSRATRDACDADAQPTFAQH